VAARMAAVEDHAFDIGRGADDADDLLELLLLDRREMRDGPRHVAARGRLAFWEHRDPRSLRLMAHQTPRALEHDARANPPTGSERVRGSSRGPSGTSGPLVRHPAGSAC